MNWNGTKLNPWSLLRYETNMLKAPFKIVPLLFKSPVGRETKGKRNGKVSQNLIRRDQRCIIHHSSWEWSLVIWHFWVSVCVCVCVFVCIWANYYAFERISIYLSQTYLHCTRTECVFVAQRFKNSYTHCKCQLNPNISFKVDVGLPRGTWVIVRKVLVYFLDGILLFISFILLLLVSLFFIIKASHTPEPPSVDSCCLIGIVRLYGNYVT